MATIKVKLRPSSVVGRAGTVYYQVTHRRATQQITTNIRLQPDEWDAIGEQVVVSVADKSIIQNRIGIFILYYPNMLYVMKLFLSSFY